MGKGYGLGFRMNYIPTWGVVDAVREYFQNALDEESLNPSNKMSFNYDIDSDTLTISNKFGKLDKSTLLLGGSEKADNDNTIGKHGEGYKVATVVALRNNLKVKIYNNDEYWVARVVKSMRYASSTPSDSCSTGVMVKGVKVYPTKVVEFNISKCDSNPYSDEVVFVIEGITGSMYSQIIESNLHLQKFYGGLLDKDVIVVEDGRILLSNAHKGNIYVNGLFVTHNADLELGYDFRPRLVNLDRDRRVLSDFSMSYNSSRLLSQCSDEALVKSLINSKDAEYMLKERYFVSDVTEKVKNTVAKEFVTKHGRNTAFCSTSDDFNTAVKQGVKAVLVTEVERAVISDSSYVRSDASLIARVKPLSEQLEEWVYSLEDLLEKDKYEEGKELLNKILQVM